MRDSSSCSACSPHEYMNSFLLDPRFWCQCREETLSRTLALSLKLLLAWIVRQSNSMTFGKPSFKQVSVNRPLLSSQTGRVGRQCDTALAVESRSPSTKIKGKTDIRLLHSQLHAQRRQHTAASSRKGYSHRYQRPRDQQTAEGDTGCIRGC